MITAQFVIERHCPEEFTPDVELMAEPPEWPETPLCVWVELDGDGLLCGGKSYRILVDRGAVNDAGQAFEIGGAGVLHVCEHMGHLIE